MILHSWHAQFRIKSGILGLAVEIPLWPPCFCHFFGSCFAGHDEASLLAFEALRGSPRPARGQALDAKRLWRSLYGHVSCQFLNLISGTMMKHADNRRQAIVLGPDPGVDVAHAATK